MANRAALKPVLSQQNLGRDIEITFKGQGASAPLNAGGDKNALWLTITRSGTGTYSLVTVDPWKYIDGLGFGYQAATLTDYWNGTFGIPSQNSTTGIWTIALQLYKNGTAADAINNDFFSVRIKFEDSLVGS
jgi:hypothetical protein